MGRIDHGRIKQGFWLAVRRHRDVLANTLCEICGKARSMVVETMRYDEPDTVQILEQDAIPEESDTSILLETRIDNITKPLGCVDKIKNQPI